MKCICGEEVAFRAGDAPITYVETYIKASKAKTNCCNRMMAIYPKIVFELQDLPKDKEEYDDWGFK